MSAMRKTNNNSGDDKDRRFRSYSLSENSSVGSSDSEEAGARLSAGSPDISPRHVRFASVTEEIGRPGPVSGGFNRHTVRPSFQVGDQPSGDIFVASSATLVPKLGEHLATQAAMASPVDKKTGKMPMNSTEERGFQRSESAGGSVVVANSGGRAVRHASDHHDTGGIDAQEIYPPSACVFVANLPEHEEDRALEAAVTREFSRFGTVFVKIRRETKGNIVGMPYAFAQYTNDDDASKAIERGKGAMILGRPCRTEMAKANRTFIIYARRGRATITVDKAREIVEPYGELSRCEELSTQIQEAMRIPPAVFVEFVKFDPKRDLNSAVRQNDGFRIDAFDAERKPLPRGDADEEFMRKYDAERRSIFVGGIPVNTQREELMEFFSTVGEVLDATIIQKSGYPHGRIFGFVEFSRADTPDHAIQMLNGSSFRGAVLKVERKIFRQDRNGGTPRRVRSQGFNNRSSAAPRTPRAGATPARHGSSHFSGPKASTPTPAPAPAPAPAPPATTATITTTAEQAYAFQSFFPLAYPVASPAVPVDGQAILGASSNPGTPSTANPFGPTPYSYTGGYWPGMSFVQDPITGHTFWTYTSPVVPTTTSSPAPPPTAETPTRGHEQQQQPHHQQSYSKRA